MRNQQLQPYTGTFGRTQLIHLLRRTLFGVRVADLNQFENQPLQQVVTALLSFQTQVDPPVKTYTSSNDPALVDPSVPFGQTWVNTVYGTTPTVDINGPRRSSVRSWWTGLMCHQNATIREKMVFFWHNLMPTEMLTVDNGLLVYRYNKLLRDNCVGNVRKFLYDISIDPGMLIYLNGRLNTKTAPDENYARELQELFAIGKGPNSHYTEADVQAAAKVLTGWIINSGTTTAPIIPIPTFNLSRHDITNKTFSAFYGNTVITAMNNASTGPAELTQLLDMLTLHPEHSRHICRKLYQFFVHHELTPDVEADVIEPLAQIYRDNYSNPEQIKIVMQALLTSAAFFAPHVIGCMVKSPADFVIGSIRMFGMTLPGPDKYEAQYRIWLDIHTVMKNMDFDLGEPPNVAGWPAYYQAPQFYEMWVDTASYPIRKSTYERISGTGYTTNNTLYTLESRNFKAIVNFVNFVSQMDSPEDPNILLDQICDLMFGIPVSQGVKDTLKTNYLLQGQTSDYYWTDIWTIYINNPATTDAAARKVPTILKELFLDMQSAAEHHLF